MLGEERRRVLVGCHIICPHATVAQDSIDGADRGNGIWVAHALRQELVPNFPGEHARVVLLQTQDLFDDRRCGHLLEEEE